MPCCTVGDVVAVTITPRALERLELSVAARVVAASSISANSVALPAPSSGIVSRTATSTLPAKTRSSRKHEGWWHPVTPSDWQRLSRALYRGLDAALEVSPMVMILAMTLTTDSPSLSRNGG